MNTQNVHCHSHLVKIIRIKYKNNIHAQSIKIIHTHKIEASTWTRTPHSSLELIRLWNKLDLLPCCSSVSPSRMVGLSTSAVNAMDRSPAFRLLCIVWVCMYKCACMHCWVLSHSCACHGQIPGNQTVMCCVGMYVCIGACVCMCMYACMQSLLCVPWKDPQPSGL